MTGNANRNHKGSRREAGRWGRRSQPRPEESGAHPGEGPSRVCRFGTGDSMTDGVADKRAGMPGRPGRVGGGTAESSGRARQVVTASEDHADERAPMTIDRARPGPGTGLEVLGERPWAVVECWRQSHERRGPDRLPPRLRSRKPHRGASAPAARLLNLRVRNRRHGGVGGPPPRGGALPDGLRDMYGRTPDRLALVAVARRGSAEEEGSQGLVDVHRWIQTRDAGRSCLAWISGLASIEEIVSKK